jgi:protein-tyrosine-phosphatase
MLPAGVNARVDSAGFIGAHRGPPQEALDVAAARGVDLRRHKSRMVSSQAVSGAELIVVMELNQAVSLRRFGTPSRPVLVLGDLDPGHPANRTIRDPVEQPRAVFAESYDRIDRCMEELVKAGWGDR